MAFFTVISWASRPAGAYLPLSPEDDDSLRLDSTKKALPDSIPGDSLPEDKPALPLKGYTILPDTTKKDTVDVDTIPRSKSALDEPVQYTAKDSITFDYVNSRANLYGDSKVNYQNLELTAQIITMSMLSHRGVCFSLLMKSSMQSSR